MTAPTIGDATFAQMGGVAKAAHQQAAQQAIMRGVLEAEGGWPPLDSVEHAQERLDMICRLSVEGYVDGARAGAGVRAVEQWLKAEDLRRLQVRLLELEAQLAAYKANRPTVRRGR
jgi:hypothetical protein